MTTRLKVTVVKMFTPEDVFGPDHGITYNGGDMEYPEPGMTYQPCGDGVKPVVFKIEKLR
jgi:hypothetical protein